MQLRKKTFKISVIVIIAIIILSNIGPMHSFVSLFANANHHRYSSSTAGFTFLEQYQGRDTAMLKKKFDLFKKETSDTILYRLFSKNPLAFWRYIDYYKDPRYDLPYKDWKEIEKEHRLKNTDLTHWQDF